MKQYRFRNGFEEKVGNPYAVAFDIFLRYEVEIYEEGQWCTRGDFGDIGTILESLPKKSWWERGGRYLYCGDDFTGFLYLDELVVAIARDPMGTHEILKRTGVDSFPWYQLRDLYNYVREKASLVSDWPEFEYHPDAEAIQANFWMYGPWPQKYLPEYTGLKASPSTEMVLERSFLRQIEKQIPLLHLNGLLQSKGSLRRMQNIYVKAISEHIIESLTQYGKIQIPYIGTLTLRGTRLSFSTSRLLRDRLKFSVSPAQGKQASIKRKEQGRVYGGEKDPGQSPVLWAYRKGIPSRRRIFVAMLLRYAKHYENIAVANIVFQAYTDALIFRLCSDVPVTIKRVGTLRPKSGRVSFRKSKNFPKSEGTSTP